MTTVRFGMGPAAGAGNTHPFVSAFEEVLSRMIGEPVEVVLALDYRQLLADIAAGLLHFAWLPPAVFIRALDRSRVTLQLSSVREEGTRYHGALFVRASSNIEEPHELQKKKVAWVDPTSCGGFLFPRLSLLERGYDPRGFFRSEVFVGSHAAVVAAVDEGEVQAGATYVNLSGEDDTGGEDYQPAGAGWIDHPPKNPVKTILISRPIPADVICSVEGLDLPLEERIVEALLEFHAEAGAAPALQVMRARRFQRADLRSYDVVRAALNVTNSRMRRRPR